jgi:hypothetical protein
MAQTIPKKVLQALGQIAMETGKEALKQAGEITHGVISGKELLGNLTNLSDAELSQRKAEDERNKQIEIEAMMAKIQGRNVEGEMKQVEREEQQIEQQKVQQEQQASQYRQEEGTPMPTESANPHKRKKKRGSALGGGKKKTQMPDPSQLSQTAEVAGKME